MTGVIQILLSNAAFNGVLNGKVYPSEAPQKTPGVYTIVEVQGTDPVDTKDGPATVEIQQIQVLHYAANFETALDMAAKARTALDHYKGTIGGQVIDTINFFDFSTYSDRVRNQKKAVVEQIYDVRVKL